MTDSFSGGGMPYKDIPANHREHLYMEVSSVETSATGDYTILGAPGSGKSWVIWGVALDNSDNSSYLAGGFHASATGGPVVARCSASNIGTGYVELPLPRLIGDNQPVVFNCLQAPGIANTAYATIYYTVRDI